jgi:hypothetical protein
MSDERRTLERERESGLMHWYLMHGSLFRVFTKRG